MPRLPETNHRTTANASAFHVKKNSAAKAPTWNTAIKSVVTQLIGWANVLSRSKMLVTSAILKYRHCQLRALDAIRQPLRPCPRSPSRIDHCEGSGIRGERPRLGRCYRSGRIGLCGE